MKKRNEKYELPQTMTLEVSSASGYGDLIAKVVDDIKFEQKIYIMENKKIKPALEKGDRFIANISVKKGVYWAKPVVRVYRIGSEAVKVFGVIEKSRNGIVVRIAEKRSKDEFLIDDINGAEIGDYVACSLTGPQKSQKAIVIKTYGKFNLNKATEAMILEKYEIPYEFSNDAIREINDLPKIENKKRLSFLQIPFVTIDGDDSKDFDDAVYAKKTKTGFEVMVAISDVAFYVRPNTELDREAYRRGNSVYLPNIVVPMLPEKLSNDLCSLRPKEEKAVMIAIININHDGEIVDYDFKRGLIKTSARLTYDEVQDAIEGKFSSNITPVFKTVIQPLYEAFFALEKAKKKRGSLELITNETKLKLDKNGKVLMVSRVSQTTSQKIIEEAMILANICAAKALKKAKLPVMYRIHEPPLAEKLVEVKPLLKELGLKLPDSPAILPEHFNKILEITSRKGFSNSAISMMILRLQSQAKYSPENLGHFGLGLKDYAHFTSPIRRYSDILVHRALIKACNMEEGGALEDRITEEDFVDIGDHLSKTERKAISAERDLVARFLASYLEPSLEQDFEVRVSGVSNAGLFVEIETLGAEGFIPIRTLPQDDYEIMSSNLEMRGKKTQRNFVIGNGIIAKLVEISVATGGLIFKFVDKDEGVDYLDKSSRRRFSKDSKNGKKKPFKKFGNKSINKKKVKKK